MRGLRESTEGGAGAAAAVILVVLLVLTAFYYFYILVPASIVEPGAELSKAKSIGEHEWVIVVEEIEPSRSLYHYSATLSREDSFQITLEPLTSTSPKIVFVDQDEDWELSEDDYFLLTCEGGGSYSFDLVYGSEGTVLGTVEWEVGF
jgi:hypothetical protein